MTKRDYVPPLLSAVLPDVAREVQVLLVEVGRDDLAAQVERLHVLGRCKCEDDFCATLQVKPLPKRIWQGPLETIPLHPKEGMINLDVVDGNIQSIEILFRPEIRKALLEKVP